MKLDLAAPALLAAALAAVLAWRPLPPELRGPGGEAPAWGQPVLALEDWFDSREGLGVPCPDRQVERRSIDGRLSLRVPRCFSLRRLPDGAWRLADEGLAPLAAAVQVLPARGPRPAFRVEQVTPLGRLVRFRSDAGGDRVVISVVVPSRLLFSWKAKRHVEALEAVAASIVGGR